MHNRNLNKTLQPKKSSDFTVLFLDWAGSENMNDRNIMGAMVKTIQRPSLSLEDLPMRHKRQKTHHQSTWDWAPITITFNDDGRGIVSRALYEQIFRQANVSSQKDTRFDIKLQIWFHDEVVEQYTYTRCWITSIDHDNSDFMNDQQNVITCTLVFDNVDYSVLD